VNNESATPETSEFNRPAKHIQPARTVKQKPKIGLETNKGEKVVPATVSNLAGEKRPLEPR